MLFNHDSWRPSWVRGSKLQEIVWVGKDTLAWCSGVHIMFFNVKEKKMSIRWCYNQDSGEGAHCLSGHSSLSIFAFAEKINQPRILIYAYPSMTRISECIDDYPSGYLATAFTARDHLVSVGSYPYFPMAVWNWRNGDKIVETNTLIRDEVGQIIRVTLTGPTVIAQLGKTCGRLFTWCMDIAGRASILKDHEVKLPKQERILWIDWCPTSNDPLLALTDVDGHIFLSNYDGSNVYRIVLSQRCGICDVVELPMVYWFRDGIVQRTTFCQIRFFTKNVSTNRWKREWYVKSVTRPCILVVHPFNKDWLFYHTLEGYLKQIDFSDESGNPRIIKYFNYGAIHRFADFIYPWCHHMVVTADLKELTVLECYSGLAVTVFDPEIDSDIASQASHPDYPLIVLGTTQGELIFIGFVDPAAPHIVACLRLQKETLDLIKFSYSGRSLIAAEKESGNCYCVSLHRDTVYTVKALIHAQRAIADVLIFEAFKKLRVLVLFVGVKLYAVGQQIQLYEVAEGQTLITEPNMILDLPGVYHTISYMPGNPLLFVGSPYLTRQLRVQRVQDFKDVIMVDGLLTGHQVRLANIFVDRLWLYTTAFDGLVVVRDKTLKNVAACIMTHHRSDFGTVKAMANKSGDLIVCLGFNGSLVATRRVQVDKKENTGTSGDQQSIAHKVDYSLYQKYKKKITSDYASLDATARDLLTRPRTMIPEPEAGDKTWAEWREEMQIREEAVKCKGEKQAILKDFGTLKVKVKKLLNANEVCPEIEKLPVSSFDLDITGRDQKIKAGRDECEDLRLELEHNVSAMDRVTRWIREVFWESQRIEGKSLVAIFGSKHVTNYPSVAEDPYAGDHLEWAEFCKEAVHTVMEDETFRAWRLYGEEELEIELNKRLKLRREEEMRIDLLLEDEEEAEVTEEELEKRRAMEGTTTHLFVEPSPYYSQLECYGFDHVMINNRFLMHDSEKLRAYFNRAFDEMYAMKEREMNVIRERIERIRYIDSELRNMFGQKVSHIPVDPEWHWQEKPEGIIKVLDHEVKAKPYVSPSQQEILDKQAAEAERIRQLLLADDFRERALMAMMDGVLEVRWEDTIKIDVPKPSCMVEKKPEDYNAADIQAVKQYEKDVQFLQEERERYKRMLEAEYTKVMGLLEEGTDKFNEQLDELFHLKMRIEAAVNQINLRHVRGYLQIYHRTKDMQQEDQIKKEIAKKQEYESILNAHLQIFRNVHQEFVSRYEYLCNREKTMNRRFKAEFSPLGRLHMELLERQCKRRPRTNLRNLGALELLELGQHALSRTRSIYLPSECKDYLRSLDQLDIRPSTLPPTVDAPHWDQLIRIRRQRIDAEMKSRSKLVEILDVENLITVFEQRIEKCKGDVERERRCLVETRRRRIISELDVELQLVMKMGQVEIDILGDTKDTDSTILVSRTEIEAVNELIRAAGACKLNALTRLMNFRRGTLMKQWRHECQKKHLEDLQEDLRFIESVTVTKEMQLYLKRKAKGMKDDKTPQRMNEDIEAMKERFEKIISGHADRLQAIQKEIASTKCKNEQLDRQILEMNVARCEMEQRRDVIGEARQQKHTARKLRMIMKRAELIKKLQDNYAELLELQTEHELLRLRRYPTFGFKMLDDKPDKKDDSPAPRDFCPC